VDKRFIGVTTLAMLTALVVITIVGLSIGKWVHKVGGVLMLATFAAVLVLPMMNLFHGSITEYHPLKTEIPLMSSIMTFNLLGKMGFGALGGFEYVAIHAGECRNPVRVIGRSVAVAAPLIALMFILGTSSVLSLIPIDKIDLIAPIPQVLSEGLRPFGFAATVAPLAILVLLCVRISQSSVMFGGNTRLPMVAGWDKLLPAWFTRLHPRRHTPVNSIIFVGAATLMLGAVGLIGVKKQEAFQLLWNASGLFYALTYVAMFAIPLVGLRGVKPAPSVWVKINAFSGLLMTLLYVALSVVPIINVESRLTFALKISGLILVTNAIGFAIFATVRNRSVTASNAAESASAR
jgi:amino acid transporter